MVRYGGFGQEPTTVVLKGIFGCCWSKNLKNGTKKGKLDDISLIEVVTFLAEILQVDFNILQQMTRTSHNNQKTVQEAKKKDSDHLKCQHSIMTLTLIAVIELQL